MSNLLLMTLAALTTLTACSSPQEQIYRDQPLVAKVSTGMSKQQVLDIGGQPVAVSNRMENPGSCLDYQFSQTGQRQAYHISLDARDKVDHQGFTNCAGWELRQQADKERRENSGGGY